MSKNQKYPKNSFIIIIPIAIVLFLLLFANDTGFQLFLGLVLFILLTLLYLIIAEFELEVNQAGFSNQSTFNRVFKKIQGITPSEYIIAKKT